MTESNHIQKHFSSELGNMLVILFSHFSTRYMLKGNVYTKVYLVKIV